jgi:transcriptional regulator with XRE-family HTH domain
VLSDVVAQQVNRLRKNARLNREALAERCKHLGEALTAEAIANIENGRRGPDGKRRREVTVDELAALARALSVPPLALICPLGRQSQVDLRDGTAVDTWDLAQWIRGERPLSGEKWDSADVAGVRSFQMHENEAARWEWARRVACEATAEHRLRTADDADRQAEQAWQHLVEIRAGMRERGLTPPALPADLAKREEIDAQLHGWSATEQS